VSPWEFLSWVVALGVSVIVVAVAIVVVTAAVRSVRRRSGGRKVSTIKETR